LFGKRHLGPLLVASTIFNFIAMALTILYTGRGAIIEENPVTRSSLAHFGPLAPIANFAIILTIYLIIYQAARSMHADGPIRFGWFVRLGLDFSALLLPVVTFLDVLNDVAVTFFTANSMTLGQLVAIAPIISLDLVVITRAPIAIKERLAA